MRSAIIKFGFDKRVDMKDVDATLRLALLAVESLHGEDRVRIEARTRLDTQGHEVLIDSSTGVGRDLAAIFGGFVRREFGEDFEVVRGSASLSEVRS